MKEAFENITQAVDDNMEKFKSFVEVVRVLAPFMGTVLGGAFKVIGVVANAVIDIIAGVLGALKPMINAAIAAINVLITGINLVKPGGDIGKLSPIGDSPATNSRPPIDPNKSGGGGSTDIKIPVIPTLDLPNTSGSGGSTGSSGSGGAGGGGGNGAQMQSFISVPNAPQFSVAEQAARDAQNLMTSFAAATPTVTNNITVNGAIDSESTARQIVNVLNDSYNRGTGGGLGLQTSTRLE
jgi:hypothetical protein